MLSTSGTSAPKETGASPESRGPTGHGSRGSPRWNRGAKAARPSVMVATPARGRFANAVASVAVGAVVESPAPAAVRAAEAAEEALDPAPLFIKGRFPREADVLRLSAMVMGGDVVFQFTGYADGEFSDMLTEATSIAVGAIAKEIVADVTARHGRAGA